MITMRVVIADDHPSFRAELGALLKGFPFVDVVGEAADGIEAVTLAEALQPDVVILDISMPGLNGLAAGRAIKGLSPRTKLVVVTIHEEQTYRAAAEMIPADGYVQKASISDEMRPVLESIRYQTIDAGETVPLSPKLAEVRSRYAMSH